jgi:predicted flap endonuclease-1-like 5' DNA nuclease
MMPGKSDHTKATAELRQGARNYLSELRRRRSELNVPRGQGSVHSVARVPSAKAAGAVLAKPVEPKLNRAPTMNTVIRETAGVQAASQDKRRGDALSRLQGISGKAPVANMSEPVAAAKAPEPAPIKKFARKRHVVAQVPLFVEVETILDPVEDEVDATPVIIAEPKLRTSAVELETWLDARVSARQSQRSERAERAEARRIEREQAAQARLAAAEEQRSTRHATRTELRRTAVTRLTAEKPSRAVESVSKARRHRLEARIAAIEAAAAARAAEEALEAARVALIEEKARKQAAAREAAALRRAEHATKVKAAEAERLKQEEEARQAFAEASARKAEAAAKRKAEHVAKLKAAEAERLKQEEDARRAAEDAEARKAAASERRKAAAAKRLAAKQSAEIMPVEAAPVEVAAVSQPVAKKIKKPAAPKKPKLVAEAPQTDVVPIALTPAVANSVPLSSVLDLSAIPTLGPAMRQRLIQLGITNIADLASVNPDGLRTLLGSISVLANVDQWIADASNLLVQEKRAA